MRSRILNLGMIRIFGTVFAGLLGLAYGSFLNVCVSRWPQGESIVRPRSHCRHCTHTLTWWENVPLISWLALRGRCRNCRAWIGLRYPLVELAIGLLWAVTAWRTLPLGLNPYLSATDFYYACADAIGKMLFYWLLVALAALDAENFWLPNLITLPGTGVGLILSYVLMVHHEHLADIRVRYAYPAIYLVFGILAAAALILLIRWLYKLLRRREGIGLGDAKLMALLAAWLGLPGALLAFALGVVLSAFAALLLLAIPSATTQSESWATTKLPLGTFLCIGGIVSSLWGQPILAAYLHWSGF
jgi:leader peptidase (prepilin peptidase)/N-methyltransferase